MSTFYAPSLQRGQSHYQLSEEESKHCVKVLRMQVGAPIELIDGKGLQAFTILEDAHPKRSILRLESSIFHDQTQHYILLWRPPKTWTGLNGILKKQLKWACLN
jgi:16S rRNA (uracil1498-N3)-methyltransferase